MDLPSVGAPNAIERALGLGGVAFTAHPHVDPVADRLVGWGWRSVVLDKCVEATFWEWDRDWRCGAAEGTTHRLAGCEGAFYTLVPIRPRWRDERRSLRTSPGASLRPHLAFDTRPRRLSTPLLTPFNSTPTFARMERRIEAAPHDFAVTASWYVMIQNCLRVDPGPYLLGLKGAGECLVSEPEKPVTVHLVPRPRGGGGEAAEDEMKNPREAVSAAGPTESFEIHVAFAHDGPPISDGPTATDDAMNEWVTAYTAGWDKLSPGSFLGEWDASSEPWAFPIATALSPDFNNIPRTLLWRYQINTITGDVIRTVAPGCDDLCIDHPHVNPLFEGRRECRYVYASVSNETRCSGPPLGYVRVDVATGETQTWWAGNRCFCEEVVVVPKRSHASGAGPDADADAREEECWVLGMVADHDPENGARGKSSLLILDGADVSKGPVARVRLNERIPHGLHGAFVGRGGT